MVLVARIDAEMANGGDFKAPTMGKKKKKEKKKEIERGGGEDLGQVTTAWWQW